MFPIHWTQLNALALNKRKKIKIKIQTFVLQAKLLTNFRIEFRSDVHFSFCFFLLIVQDIERKWSRSKIDFTFSNATKADRCVNGLQIDDRCFYLSFCRLRHYFTIFGEEYWVVKEVDAESNLKFN